MDDPTAHDEPTDLIAVIVRAIECWRDEFEDGRLGDFVDRTIKVDGFDCRLTPDYQETRATLTAIAELSRDGEIIVAARIEICPRLTTLH